MKKIEIEVELKDYGDICNVYAMSNLIALSGVTSSYYKFLLLNLSSFFSCILFKCKGIEFIAFSTVEYFKEAEFLKALNIPFIDIRDKEILMCLDDDTIVLCYCYVEINAMNEYRDYYIGGLHSALLYKNNKNIIFSDNKGTIQLEDEDCKIIEETRYAKLFPMSPNGRALLIKKSDIKYDDKLLNKLINNQLMEIVKSYQEDRFSCINNTYFCNGLRAYKEFKRKCDELKKMGNSVLENKIFSLEIKVIIKSFLSQPTYFREEIRKSFYYYAEEKNNDILYKIGNEYSMSVNMYKRLYEYLKEYSKNIKFKAKYIENVEKIIDNIYKIDLDIIKYIKEYLEC